ncbi:MAG: hypothetical protein CFE31_07770 [Rhizobiales bacterium PAR1]|nr:MAG: hypothetical protein CFE31_07770 [Rhizobiales bacterium PAR1]
MALWLLRLFILTVVLLTLDAVWLISMNEWLYRRELGEILLNGFRIVPALLFYMIYVLGVGHFVLRPALEANNLALALRQGAFFGFVCYATYDLTNYATLKVWSPLVTSLDMAWGTILTSTAATVTFLICRRFAPLKKV